jgi:hypothetical protein
MERKTCSPSLTRYTQTPRKEVSVALIQCPAPGCKEQVIDIWLSCPRCKCPIQVLLGAQLAKEATQAAEQAAATEDPAPVQNEDQIRLAQLRSHIKDVDLSEEDEEYGNEDVADLSRLQPQETPEVLERLVNVARGTMGLGVGFGLGVPFLSRPELVHFCGLAAFLLLLSGWVIHQLASGRKS